VPRLGLSGRNAGNDRLVPESGRKRSAAGGTVGRATKFASREAGHRPMLRKFPIAGIVRIAVQASQIQSDTTVESSLAPI